MSVQKINEEQLDEDLKAALLVDTSPKLGRLEKLDLVCVWAELNEVYARQLGPRRPIYEDELNHSELRPHC